MDTKEKIAMAQEILNDSPASNVKIMKRDGGLLEKTTEAKIILTEDNRELLRD